LSDATTASLPALRAFLEGEQKYRRSRFREAAADYTRAVEADSAFAMAFHRLSQAYGWVEPFTERSLYYAARAEELADQLPERDQLLLRGSLAMDHFRQDGIAALDEFTARRPDDVEGWYMAGELYFHVGDRVPQPRQRARDAFLKAIELDPGFGPAYIHLVDFALVEQDSAAVREIIARHRALDPTSPHARGLALVEALAFGDSAAREAAVSALDTAAADVLVTGLSRFYWSGSFFPNQAGTLGRALLDPRLPEVVRPFAVFGMAREALSRGHGRAGHDIYRQYPETMAGFRPEFAQYAERAGLLWYLNGLPYTDLAARALEKLDPDASPANRYLVGASAASEQRWSAVERETGFFEAEAERLHSIGDSVAAAEMRAFAHALRGYAALQREDHDAARAELEAALPMLPDVPIQQSLRYELGKLFLAGGELNAAERYLESLEYYTTYDLGTLLTVPVEYYLGNIAEARGDLAQARLHYARFVNWWEDADPELRPFWQLGVTALERLAGEPRN
jgi:serine/threonine-protein kinase